MPHAILEITGAFVVDTRVFGISYDAYCPTGVGPHELVLGRIDGLEVTAVPVERAMRPEAYTLVSPRGACVATRSAGDFLLNITFERSSTDALCPTAFELAGCEEASAAGPMLAVRGEHAISWEPASPVRRPDSEVEAAVRRLLFPDAPEGTAPAQYRCAGANLTYVTAAVQSTFPDRTTQIGVLLGPDGDVRWYAREAGIPISCVGIDGGVFVLTSTSSGEWSLRAASADGLTWTGIARWCT